MRRFVFIAGIAGLASLLTYVFDPDRGRTRRARFADQTKARARHANQALRSRVAFQKGVVVGLVHDLADTIEADWSYEDETLLQKVRSEVLGHMDNVEDIEISTRDGCVIVGGRLESEERRSRLLDLIQEVKGVTSIDDRIEVNRKSSER